MEIENGDIVWVNDLYKQGNSGRPALVVGNTEMPDHGRQFVAVNLSSRTYHARSLEIEESDYAGDSLPFESHALPWVFQSLSPEHLQSYVTCLTEEKLEEISEAARSYIGADATK